MKSLVRLIAVATALCLPAAVPAQDWVAKSNEHAQVLLEAMARFNPEFIGRLGVEGVDRDVIDLRPDVIDRKAAAVAGAAEELRSRLGQAEDPKVRQDLNILIEAAEEEIQGDRLNQKYLLPYFNAPQVAFFGMQALLDPQLSEEKHAAALVRLQRYAGLETGYSPMLELARARIEEKLDDESLLGPYRAEVERDLANAPRFIAGIGQLFDSVGVAGYEDALAAFDAQVSDWNAWVTEIVLPRARDDFRLPAELYAWNLKEFGVDADPETLIREASAAFVEIRNEMRALAPLVAAARGWEESDYRVLLGRLKSEQLAPDEILPWYQEVLAKLEQTIVAEDVVTLPERDAIIRLGTEAESAAQPAPHMRPPRLIGNTGQRPEFVLPLANPGLPGEETEAMDDFTHRAAAWTLTVHEARPGHEMQFSSLVERGVSIARAVFAFNSVNVEGWALYSEAVMKPYMPLDGQLISLQHRMLRAVRAFLDPMANTGRIGYDDIRKFLEEELALSPAMSRQEADRYTFRAPGQATSYFVGYQNLLSLRAETELALGEAFDEKAFHDFVLAQGLLPPDLLAEAVRNGFVAPRLAGG
ncbi:MAG: DUF885 domain-containing protein [Gammaproteobacteria bacterium]